MSIRHARREAAIDRMADHLLREGMAGASLRPLAAAAGTSDRMLLYYFADKDEILRVTLERVALRLAGLLDQAIPPRAPRAFPILVEEVLAAIRSPALRPFMQLWLELAAGAARGHQPHRLIAGDIADGFLNWVASRLDADNAGEGAAARLLAAVEGVLLLDAVGRENIADAAGAALPRR